MGEGHVGAIVGEVGDGDGGGPVGEDVVLDLEDLFGHFWGGDGDGVEEAEAKVEEAAVAVGEAGQSAVGELAHHVHVADDGERFWAWGEGERRPADTNKNFYPYLGY